MHCCNGTAKGHRRRNSVVLLHSAASRIAVRPTLILLITLVGTHLVATTRLRAQETADVFNSARRTSAASVIISRQVAQARAPMPYGEPDIVRASLSAALCTAPKLELVTNDGTYPVDFQRAYAAIVVDFWVASEEAPLTSERGTRMRWRHEHDLWV